MPFKMGPWELGLIVLLVFVIFGAGKLPEVAGALGKGIRSFRSGEKGSIEADKKTEVKAAAADPSPPS